jgi:ElaB/YqjD/DUF883 family membrane-anchored ribosome-binding protein
LSKRRAPAKYSGGIEPLNRASDLGNESLRVLERRKGVGMTNNAAETGQEGLVGQASAQVQEAASTAQDKAVELKEQGKSKLGETLDQRTNEAGSQARKMAHALRRSGEQLSNEGGSPQAAGLTKGAADRIERLGSYLERTSGDELVHDMEAFARRRPWVVAGIGLVAGLAASRFLKASSERRYEVSMNRAGVGHAGYSGDRYTNQPLLRDPAAVGG